MKKWCVCVCTENKAFKEPRFQPYLPWQKLAPESANNTVQARQSKNRGVLIYIPLSYKNENIFWHEDKLGN